MVGGGKSLRKSEGEEREEEEGGEEVSEELHRG